VTKKSSTNDTQRQGERAVKECYSTWGDTYFDEYYGNDAPYPPVHRDLVKKLVIDSGAKSLLDAGCGPASILRAFGETELELFGFDLTPEMIVEAKTVMRNFDVPAENIWQGSVTDKAAFAGSASKTPGSYDAAICIGVLPHITESEESTVIENLRDAVQPGGLVLLEARNAFFSLFTLNRYSWDFFAKDLIDFDDLIENKAIDQSEVKTAQQDIQQRFRMDQPPIRGGKQDEPGYDEILSRSHNPLVLARQFTEHGFKDVKPLFYHFHRLPPLTEGKLGPAFQQLSIEMEDPNNWRGYFMASAFILAGIRE
jgi:2-polyprenyl-3-methyl-5-hydroxy-6-metoxy-1,4-benzoquinol methylase